MRFIAGQEVGHGLVPQELDAVLNKVRIVSDSHCFFLFFWWCGLYRPLFLFESFGPPAADYVLVSTLMDSELLKLGDPLFILVILLSVFFVVSIMR